MFTILYSTFDSIGALTVLDCLVGANRNWFAVDGGGYRKMESEVGRSQEEGECN
ncbi:hypothetical protein N8371_05915 [Vicingaceae bacterium]|nr:hypothetical protein [Vicingaceae bacterium]MDB4061318.1 hypothetical protein [Vicingaceae bacterium]MDC1451927.1 hypothetical protein [Vicingaceae bacterium]